MPVINSAQKAQNFANRGRQAIEQSRFEVAMDMLSETVSLMPEVLEYRELLRTAQILTFKYVKGGKAGFGLKVGAVFARQKVLSLVKKGQPAEAMAEAENLLAQNPLDPENIDVAVKAADAAGMYDHADVSLALAFKYADKDIPLFDYIATSYERHFKDKTFDVDLRLNEISMACDVYTKLLELKSSDVAFMRRNKDAIAGKMLVEQEYYRAHPKTQEVQGGAGEAGGSDDLEAQIAKLNAQIEREPKNMNTRRALARLYAQNNMFEEAIQTLQAAIEFSGTMDPEIDRLMSQYRIQYYELQIQALSEQGDAEGAEALKTEKNQFVFDDLAARVQRYPNDLQLRYQLGVQYFTYGYYDEALEQLQLAQKSPKDRLWALYYLALCFLQKGQSDMAIMQLETARDQMPTMDELKKNVVYQLGLCAEEQGDYERAYQYYKDVYSTDVGFKDLSDRMMAVSQALKDAQA